MKKKLLALGVAAVMLAGCLTACGNDGGTGAKGGWTPVQEFTYKDIASWGSMQTA